VRKKLKKKHQLALQRKREAATTAAKSDAGASSPAAAAGQALKKGQKLPPIHLDKQLVHLLSKQAMSLKAEGGLAIRLPSSFFAKVQEEEADAEAWSHRWGWEEGVRRLSCRDMLEDGWVERAWDRVEVGLHT
jgi:hypothetical protein